MFLETNARIFVLCISLDFFLVHACHKAHTIAATPSLEISGRRKRSDDINNYYVGNDTDTSPEADDADPFVSSFFTDCMQERSGEVFESWRSVVDFVLRDTYWYEASDNQYCSENQDSVDCWQERMNYLMKTNSTLLESAKKCVRDFHAFVNTSDNSSNTETYDQYYTYMRRKRSYASANSDDTAENIIHPTLASKHPIYPPQPSVEYSRECPKVSPLEYGFCIAQEILALASTAAYRNFPSLENYDEASTQKFVTEYYSQCRITTQDEGSKTYKETCTNARTRRRRNIYRYVLTYERPATDLIHTITPDLTSFESCFVLDMLEIVKPSSPIYTPVKTCFHKYVDPNPTPASTTTAEKTPQNTTVSSTSTTSTNNFPTSKYYYTVHSSSSYPTSPTTQTRSRLPGKRTLVYGSCDGMSHWTKWYNEDTPDGIGDHEDLQYIRNKFRGQVCEYPEAIEARLSNGRKIYHFETMKFYTNRGSICIHAAQDDGTCEDYEIRFCCKIPEPHCSLDHQWTPWYNSDRPGRGGDFETLARFVLSGRACKRPIEVDARLRVGKRPYWKGFDIIDLSPTTGLSCVNSQQPDGHCKDYEVRFCCPVRSTDYTFNIFEHFFN